MQRRTLLTGAAALALVRPAFAAKPTKVLFWHAMNGALGDEVNNGSPASTAARTRSRSTAIYKGGYADVLTADDRRLPRRPGAAYRADLRGRHRHHAGRRQGGEAGLGAVQGDRRRDRPGGLHPLGARLLQPGRRAHGVDAVQLLDRGDVVQQGRVPQGRPRPGEAAGDLAGRRRPPPRRSRQKNARRDRR